MWRSTLVSRFFSTNLPSFGAMALPQTTHSTGFAFRQNVIAVLLATIHDCSPVERHLAWCVRWGSDSRFAISLSSGYKGIRARTTCLAPHTRDLTVLTGTPWRRATASYVSSPDDVSRNVSLSFGDRLAMARSAAWRCDRAMTCFSGSDKRSMATSGRSPTSPATRRRDHRTLDRCMSIARRRTIV